MVFLTDINRDFLENDFIINVITNVIGKDKEEVKRELKRMNVISFSGDSDVSGFASFSGVCISESVLSAIRVNSQLLEMYGDRVGSIVDFYKKVVIVHEATHYVCRHLEKNLNYSSPEKEGVKEAGTLVEIKLFGEEIDYVKALISGYLSIDWIQTCLDKITTNQPPVLLPLEAQDFRARSVCMAFKCRHKIMRK